MADVKTRMVIDGESSKATQATAAAEEGIRRLGPAADAASAKAEAAAGRISRAWAGLNQKVQVDGIMRGNFSAEMIGSALMSVTADAAKLTGQIAGLNAEQTKFTESMSQVAIGLATGNPMAAMSGFGGLFGGGGSKAPLGLDQYGIF